MPVNPNFPVDCCANPTWDVFIRNWLPILLLILVPVILFLIFRKKSWKLKMGLVLIGGIAGYLIGNFLIDLVFVVYDPLL